MFVKNFNDTLVAFQFNDGVLSEKSKPDYMSIEFTLDSTSVGDYYWHGKNLSILCESSTSALPI
jgi:hypothetical protein